MNVTLSKSCLNHRPLANFPKYIHRLRRLRRLKREGKQEQEAGAARVLTKTPMLSSTTPTSQRTSTDYADYADKREGKQEQEAGAARFLAKPQCSHLPLLLPFSF